MLGRIMELSLVGAAVALGATAPAWAAGRTELVSVGQGGAPANGVSHAPAISEDGRFVAFASYATNLVPGDTDGMPDVFVRYRTTERVSVGPGGVQANGVSDLPSISEDGRFIAFLSTASNLVAGDTNGTGDIFVRHRKAGTTERASLGQGGVQANGDSGSPAISASGRYVAFVSSATNLVAGDTNGAGDVFVHDRQTGRTERVSVGANGVQADGESSGPAISENGRFVAFVSSATNLVPGVDAAGKQVYVRDRKAGTNELASAAPGGAPADYPAFSASISGDGRFVTFRSDASNLVPPFLDRGITEVYVHDRATGTNELAAGVPSTNESLGPTAVSAGGRFVAFLSTANTLAPGGSGGAPDSLDAFVRDRVRGVTQQVSVGPGGVQGDADVTQDGIGVSKSGPFVAFASAATNLVLGDTNGAADVFVHRP